MTERHTERPDTSERSVRLALPRDVEAVAVVQGRAWRLAYQEVLPGVVLDRIEQSARLQWAEAIERPPTSAHHLLVAVAAHSVVGFAAVQPEEDVPAQAGELTVLAVDPDHRGAGHGSRLLAAAAETLDIDGFATATAWLPEIATDVRDWLREAGWSEDGGRRELDLGADPGDTLVELRMHTALR